MPRNSLEVPPQRRRLAVALKRLRVAADLSTYQLAERIGISQSRVSRIENARTAARVSEVEEWARVTDAPAERRKELVALAEDALIAPMSWPAAKRAGVSDLPDLQRQVGELEATAGLIQVYTPLTIPGLLHTPQYAAQTYMIGHGPDQEGAAEWVAERMNRQAALYDEKRRFEFVIPEAALRWRSGPRDVLLGQLDRIGVVSTLPNVEVGLIPQDAEAPVWRSHGFTIFLERGDEDPLVHVEPLGSWLSISDPEAVTRYREAFDRLRGVAVSEDDARALLDEIEADLRQLGG
jgi:transcriptional regulator with XRE-family HTH domain